jgi:Rrf2 family transcriptional regulator, iron-sulfur cluster assembly transcription factor
LKLCTKSRYGIRLLLDMTKHNGSSPIQLGEVAKRQNLPLKYLEQIIIPLKKANYLESLRGRKGGHRLAKPASEITVGEIVALLENGSALVDCTGDQTVCDRSAVCPVRLVWKEASEALFGVLNKVTFADLAQKIDDFENLDL